MDINVLIDRVTEEVMKILSTHKTKISIISNEKEEKLEEFLKEQFDITNTEDSNYVLLSKDKYNELINKEAVQTKTDNKIINDNFIDFTSKKVITERDLKSVDFKNIKKIKVKKSTILTALAKDILKSAGVCIEY